MKLQKPLGLLKLLDADLQTIDSCVARMGSTQVQWTAVPTFPDAIACEKKSVADITPDAFERDYVHRAIPCVLTDVTAEWPCRHAWSLSFFADTYGDMEVSVDDGSKGKMRTTMREYIDRFDEFARDAEASACGRPDGQAERHRAVPANVELRG